MTFPKDSVSSARCNVRTRPNMLAEHAVRATLSVLKSHALLGWEAAVEAGAWFCTINFNNIVSRDAIRIHEYCQQCTFA